MVLAVSPQNGNLKGTDCNIPDIPDKIVMPYVNTSMGDSLVLYVQSIEAAFRARLRTLGGWASGLTLISRAFTGSQLAYMESSFTSVWANHQDG